MAQTPPTPEIPSPRSDAPQPAVGQQQPGSQQLGVGANWCAQCQKSFERSDHFARHVQSHRDLRLFQCPWCPKSFNRGDLLYRHKQIHTRRKDGAQHSARASRACRSCVQSKAKCTDQKPCKRCISKGIPCEAALGTKKRSISTATESPRNVQQSPLPDIGDTSVALPENEQSQLMGCPTETATVAQDFPSVPFTPSDIATALDADACPDAAFQLARGGYSILDAFLLPADGFEVDPGCFDLDLETLQVLTQPVPNEPLSNPNPNDGPQPPCHLSPASSRFEFFERSPWLWTPVCVDHAYATQDNLKVNENALDSSFGPQERLYFQSSLTADPVDSGCRDRILFMIFNTAKSSISLQSFPSASFLDRMVQVYFGWNNLQSNSWIHSPSFVPADGVTELVGLIIAAGSSSISIPTVWKMGYALQERSRLSLSAAIESDNSRVRELQTMQAYLLWVSMGLWSGFKRNMEIAESFLAAPITMLRRCGSFSRHPYAQEILPTPDDEGSLLHAKWIAWVHQESLKRAATFALITDIRCSMAYLKPPNCSLTELSCPLPAARDLWLAPTASTWKETLLSRPPIPSTQVPTWASIMEDGSLLDGLTPHYDTALVALVVVHGFWSQIWAYHESRRFFRAKNDRASQARTMLWLSCQQQDLAQCLSTAKRELVKYALDPAQVQIISEFSLMALNVSPRELQQFAGRLGEEEAQTMSIHQTLEGWMNGSEFRAAVWHAGQIFRLARTQTLTQLREFCAIALYQASLTLWAYGLLSKALRTASLFASTSTSTSTSISTPGDQNEGRQVFLDGGENSASTAFITLGRGNPGISIGINKVFCPLTNVKGVMGAACDIYRDNFGLETASLPPLLESLISLMTDLGSISADTIPLVSHGLR